MKRLTRPGDNEYSDIRENQNSVRNTTIAVGGRWGHEHEFHVEKKMISIRLAKGVIYIRITCQVTTA